MQYEIHILPGNIRLWREQGSRVLDALREAGCMLETPCGGKGTCGKCLVLINGEWKRACHELVDQDITIRVPDGHNGAALADGLEKSVEIDPLEEGYLIALDIGTTTVVCYLLDPGSGSVLSVAGSVNPQKIYGADVISRIQAAIHGKLEQLQTLICGCVEALIRETCMKAQIEPEQIGIVCAVGNPAMQQLFMGIRTDNLAEIPFAPVLKSAYAMDASILLPVCKQARFLVVPDVAGFVGSDTLGCVLSTGMNLSEEITLLIDIGTNGEMVLGNRIRMAACSTAAGPALEGAGIRFGMRGEAGAIDHVTVNDGKIICHVIGEEEAVGICGSGLIDAVAAFLDMGFVNSRGRIQTSEEIDGQRILRLTDQVYVTQEDIRAVQLAKGAVAAGIELMAEYLEISFLDIKKVYLAGAFGTYMDSGSACRIGLIPDILKGRIEVVGNAAGMGAKRIALNQKEWKKSEELCGKIEFLELASLPAFQKVFARRMRL